MDEILVATVSMTTTSEKAANISSAKAFIRRAASAGAQWVVLPEIWAFHGPYDKLWDMAEEEGGPLNSELASLAQELGIVIFAGSVGERPDRLSESSLRGTAGHKRVYNTSYVFSRTGQILSKYRKTHLFNLHDSGGRSLYCESDGFLAGDEPPRHFEVNGWKVGLAICYDLRFPQLFTRMAASGPLDLFVIPSAFTLATGMYHWELLLRARAVECQAWVVAANQTGTHSPGKTSFGHSMIVDPWGHKVADTGNKPGVVFATVSKKVLADYRAQLPALANRRPELY
jgi:predicted amidohydrolase